MSKRKNHREKKKKEAEQFFQEDDEEDEESKDHGFASFGFCTVNKGSNYAQAITDIVTETAHTGAEYNTLTAPQQAIVQENAKYMYLACAFLCQNDRKRYGRFWEEIENNYTKGNSKYPTDLVTAYMIISE